MVKPQLVVGSFPHSSHHGACMHTSKRSAPSRGSSRPGRAAVPCAAGAGQRATLNVPSDSEGASSTGTPVPPSSKKRARKHPTVKRPSDVCAVCGELPNKDGSNWHLTRRDDRGRQGPEGCLCGGCGSYVDASPYTLDELLQQKERISRAIRQHASTYSF